MRGTSRTMLSSDRKIWKSIYKLNQLIGAIDITKKPPVYLLNESK